MKTSKILFISFFSLLGLVLLSIPIIVSSTIKEQEHARSLFNKVEKELPVFNHLIVANNSCFSISNSESGENTLIYSFPKDSTIDEINFQLNGDTLTLPYQNTKDKQSIKIRCGKVKSITCKVSLSIKMAQDTLNISSESGQILMRSESIKQLNIKGTGGSIRTPKPFIIEELNADLYNTRLKFNNIKINQLNASMAYHSELIISRANEIIISKDSESKFQEN